MLPTLSRRADEFFFEIGLTNAEFLHPFLQPSVFFFADGKDWH
jgi:hypothetical protein